MPLPDYQTIMLPLLEFSKDGNEHTSKEAVETLSHYFNLTDEEKTALLPSGTQAIFNNRVGWATTYLKKAGLIESNKRAVFRITARGKEVLFNGPKTIDVAFLNQFQEFIDFRLASSSPEKANNNSSDNIEVLDKTPEEVLDDAYQKIRQALAQELLIKIKSLPPSFFEKLVVELLVKMGYGGSIKDAGKAMGKTGDEGIDGIIKEDRLGLDVIYIQAKRWDNTVVGRPEIQGFVGALAGQGAKKGIFITTSKFSSEARSYSPRNETKIVLMDGEQLAQYMIDFNLGVSSVTTYEIKKLDSDYFGDE